MDDNFGDVFGLMAGFGIILAIVWFVGTVLLILLAIWIQYTIMWRAVRRGMREFHYGGKVASHTVQQTVPQPVVPPAPPA